MQPAACVGLPVIASFVSVHRRHKLRWFTRCAAHCNVPTPACLTSPFHHYWSTQLSLKLEAGQPEAVKERFGEGGRRPPPSAAMTVEQQQQQNKMHTTSVLHTQLKAAMACVLLAVGLLGSLAAVTYVAWLYCGKLLLATVVAAEASFAAYYFTVLVRDFNAIPDQHEPVDHDPKATIESFLRHMERVEDIQQFLSQWFLDAPYDSIKGGNVKELIAFAIYYKTLEQMEEAGLMPELDALLDKLQSMHQFNLPEGYNPDLKFMSHLWGEVPHIYRPLFFYLVMELLEVLCWGMLRINGYRRHTINGCVYYTLGLPEQQCGQSELQQQQGTVQSVQNPAQQKTTNQQQLNTQGDHLQDSCNHRSHSDHHQPQQQQSQRSGADQQRRAGSKNSKQRRKSRRDCQQHTQAASASLYAQDQQAPSQQHLHHTAQSSAEPDDVSSVPLVFLHGVGAGLLPYLGIIFTLAATGRPLLLPVWKHVSMRITRTIPTVEDSAEIAIAAMERHGVKSAAVIGHSYGSCIAARIVKAKPELVHTLALIDPVCFAMFMPNLVRYFLYTTKLSGDWLADFIIALLSSELHCARNFTRNFFWTSINLWDEHLPERTLVALVGNDVLCPTAFVKEWLESHTKAKVLYKSSAAHGAGLLLSPSWQGVILQHLMQLLQSPSSSAAVAAEPVEQAAAAAAGVEVVAGGAADAASRTESTAPADSVDASVLVVDGVEQQHQHQQKHKRVSTAARISDTGAACASDAGKVGSRTSDVFDDDVDSMEWRRERDMSFMALPIGGLDDAVDIDALYDAATEFVAGFVEVVRSSTSTLQQQGKGVWEGLVQGLPAGLHNLPAGLPNLPVGLPNLPVGLPNLPSLPVGLPNLPAVLPAQLQQWQQHQYVRRTCSADATKESEGCDQGRIGQWFKSAWVGS